MEEEGNDFSDEILEQNLSKITDPTIDTVVIMFPYNQHNLFVPDDKDWSKITKKMRYSFLLIVSPNALKVAKPAVSDNRIIITVHERILNYWKEIRSYLEANANIKYIQIISSDIDDERVERDYNLVFSDKEFETGYLTVIIPNSIWKKVYQIREKIVLMLPIGLYEALGKSR